MSQLPRPPQPPPQAAAPSRPRWSGATFDRRNWHELGHLPDAGSGPFWADLQILRRPLAFAREVQARCGPVARTVIGGHPHVLLLGAPAVEAVLTDRAKVFSAQGGWSPLMGGLFPRGLLLRDGEEHRHHRRLLLPSMRRETLEAYLTRMEMPVAHAVSQWVAQRRLPQLGLPQMRLLALSRAADLLLGLQDARAVHQAENDFGVLVEASTALLRLSWLPGPYRRGLQARQRLVQQLGSLTRARRAQAGEDLLSQLVLARDEEGHRLDDGEIVDHLVFLMMAAHDTTASALSSAIGLLAQHPQWQEVLRRELEAEDLQAPLWARLQGRVQMGRVIREVLRLNPPVALLQRQTLRETELQGRALPAGARLTLMVLHVQRDPQWWHEPDRFNPDRFRPEALDKRSAHALHPSPHPYAWAPFGGGVHLCLGLHLAEAQMRLVLGTLLSRARLSLPAGQAPRWRHAPITHPADGLAVALEPLDGAAAD